MARTRENRLNGLFPLSYLGVNSVSPQNLVQVVGAPTPNDSKNFYIGDLWLDRTNETLTPAIPPTLNDLYVLLALDGGVATWAPFSGGVENLDLLTSNSGGPVGPLGGNINLLGDTTTIVGVGNPATHTITFSTVGTGVVSTLTGNSGGAVPPTAGNINVLGDTTTIDVVGNPGTSTLTISAIGTGLVQTLTGDTGPAVAPIAGNINVISNVAANNAGASVLFSGAGDTLTLNTTDANNNVFIGKSSGNTTVSGISNTAAGESSLALVSSGNGNSIFGTLAAALLTTGSNNVIAGSTSLGSGTSASANIVVGTASATSLVSGQQNIIVGTTAGTAYTGAESSNIILGQATGTLGESNTIRIGVQGGGAGQQNAAFMAGINGVTVTNPVSVVIDSVTNQLGTSGFAPLIMSGGTWTPAILVGGSSTGITYNGANNFGSYLLFTMGTTQFVFISGSVAVTSIGVLTGNIQVTNLPFTIANPLNGGTFVSNWVTGINIAATSANAVQTFFTALAPTTTVDISVGYNDGTSHTSLNDTEITLPFQFGIVLYYQTT